MAKSEDLSTLIPIKGISYARKKELARNCSIYDISGLLAQGRTFENRKAIAEGLDIDVRHVTNWLMQADLWRVYGMTSDLAYALVLAGIRCVADLARASAAKLTPAITPIFVANPELEGVTDGQLDSIILSAKTVDENGKNGIGYTLSLDGEGLEEPTHLFGSDLLANLTMKSDSEIISEGLASLQDITIALPLPHTLSGCVKMRHKGSKDADAEMAPDILVTVSGIANPSEQKTENDKGLNCYTDGDGKFLITLPDKYNMQEKITFTLSQGGYKQTFIKQSSELIDKVYIPGSKTADGKVLYANELIAKFDELEVINRDVIRLEQELETLLLIKAKQDSGKWSCTDEEHAFVEEHDKKKLESGLETKKRERDKVLEVIYGADATTNDYEKTLTNLLSRTNLDANVGDFILIHEIFTSTGNDKPRALPSVKLMGEGDDIVRLPTDTAPSRMFSYTMLQRLVEPNVTPPIRPGEERVRLQNPIDVSAYKKSMAENPENVPQASSLGIGYVLNMHQAWVPDGFALGTLLYSTILAPGEEQRLVVREQSQSYTVYDNAAASERVSEEFASAQDDDTTATYDRAVEQLSTGSSSSKFSTSTKSFGGSAAGGYGGFFSLGLSAGYSKSRGSASSSSRQSNSSNEASAAAQNFQHAIKMASEKVSQAKRVSVRAATSNETDSVATRIIANHNHSHAMTIQYWEVMRRYRLETCIDGVDLVLFVPMKLVQFLPKGQRFYLPNAEGFTPAGLTARYDMLLRYYDLLYYRLPYKYRTGLALIQRFASTPNWEMEKRAGGSAGRQLTMTLEGGFLEIDNIRVTLILKNGKGSLEGQCTSDLSGLASIQSSIMSNNIRTTEEVKKNIPLLRAQSGSSTMTFTFTLPAGVTEQDYGYIRIENHPKPLSYRLYGNYEVGVYKNGGKDKIARNDSAWYAHESKAVEEFLDEHWDLYKDNKGTGKDLTNIAHYATGVPENFMVNEIRKGATLSPGTLQSLAPVTLKSCSVRDIGNKVIEGAVLTAYTLQYGSVSVDLSYHKPILRFSELQKMEETLQHVATETLRYSQAVWAMLTDNERAIMLEPYTVDMNFKNYFNNEVFNKLKNDINIPLLNCINVKKMIGFYGNCMMFPFTYPQSLAEKLGKTAAEVQDALYRYHASNFRVPSTVISLPTNGMIGEAVLGETNVSEEIDLTRFWNWKDSPIDSMGIDKDYLNGTDYLRDKQPGGITPLNLSGVAAPQAVTVPDLVNALVQKQTPQFNDITGLQQTATLLQNASAKTVEAQNNALNQSALLAQQALGYASKQVDADVEKYKADKGIIDNKKKKEEPQQGGGQQAGQGGGQQAGQGGGQQTGQGGGQQTGQGGGQQAGQGGGQQGSEQEQGGTPPSGKNSGGKGKGGNEATQPPSVPVNECDLDDLFDDISIAELGFKNLKPDEEEALKCAYAFAISMKLPGLEELSEYKRYHKKEDRSIVAKAGAYVYKHGLKIERLKNYLRMLETRVRDMVENSE